MARGASRENGRRVVLASPGGRHSHAAGHRIAPFDIESVLATDSAVVEASVVDLWDEGRQEVIEALVVLSMDVDLGLLARRREAAARPNYGTHGAPRRVHIVHSLPKTPSGEVQRFIRREAPDTNSTLNA